MKHNFKNLEIWQKLRLLVKEIYLLTAQLPDSEKYGLVSQMRRAAVSVPSNIAEGCGRNTDKDFARFLGIAVGSISELETQLYLLVDLEFIAEATVKYLFKEIENIRKMITGFIKKLNRGT